MRRRFITSFLIASEAFLIALVAAPAQAQQALQRTSSSGFAFEALRPSIRDADASLFSAAYFLSAHQQLSNKTRAVVEVPFAYASFNDVPSAGKKSVFGNPYVGVQTETGNVTFDVGARLPLAKDEWRDGIAVGVVADIQRLEAFVPKLWSLSARMAYQSTPTNGLTYGVQVLPALVVPTGGSDGQTSEVLVGYGVSAGYRNESARVNAGFAGRANLSEDNITFAERTMHYALLTGDFGRAQVRPGFYFALPLDHDLRDAITATFGLTLQVGLGK